jgi:hypothetical protein
MHQEFNFTLTPKAVAAALAHGLQESLHFQLSAEMPTLQVGDLFSTEETMPLVFVIRRRHFHFVNPSYLQIGLLLDLPGE